MSIKIKDPDTDAVLYSGEVATKAEPSKKLSLVSRYGDSNIERAYFNKKYDGGILMPLVKYPSGEDLAVYTNDWRELQFYGNYQKLNRGGRAYPGGRPTALDYVAGMDTKTPPQPEAEAEPEAPAEAEPEAPAEAEDGGHDGAAEAEPEAPPEAEDGGHDGAAEAEDGGSPGEPEAPAGGKTVEDTPAPGVKLKPFTEADLIEYMGDDAPPAGVARQAVKAATDYVDNYTRGAGFHRVRYPKPGINSVIATVAARMAANPGGVSRRDQAGGFSRSLGQGFNGLNLTERQALERYRRTAR